MPGYDLLAFLGGLLLTPGPTNLLLAVSSASSGWRRAAPMLVAVAVAYLAVMAAVAVLAALMPADGQAALRSAMKLCAILWLLWLAYRVWTGPDDEDGGRLVDTRQVFVTTLVNPKAVIVALLVQSNGLAPWLVAATALLVCLAGFVWILVGLAIRRNGSSRIGGRVLRRASAICLAGFGVLLAGAI